MDQEFGTTNPVVGIPQIHQHHHRHAGALQHQERRPLFHDFRAPQSAADRSRALQREPRRMTVAAKAQYEEVKSETAQAMGDQQIRQKQKLDGRRGIPPERELSQDKDLARKAEARNRARQGVRPAQAQQAQPQSIRSRRRKVGVDIHQAHLDANPTRATKLAMKLRHRPSQDRPAKRSSPTAGADGSSRPAAAE